ncbi:hypothetical protein AAHA92_09110 [Salvia divinorum]|uniref:Metallothionein-like protein n=1 Tax=Salvia divinorum TaxID=28513 RepID=A0ABD1HRR4_SALDI
MSSGCKCGSNCSCGSGCGCEMHVEKSTSIATVEGTLRELRKALARKEEMDAGVDPAAPVTLAAVDQTMAQAPATVSLF